MPIPVKCPKCDFRSEIKVTMTLQIPGLPKDGDHFCTEKDVRKYMSNMFGELLDNDYFDLDFVCPVCGELFIMDINNGDDDDDDEFEQPWSFSSILPGSKDIKVLIENKN